VQKSLAEFYADVNTFWRYGGTRVNPINDAVVVSIAGGSRDLLIRSDLCDLTNVMPLNQSITVHATALTNVWLTTDHQVTIGWMLVELICKVQCMV